MAIDELQLVLTARELLTELPESVHFSRENLRQHIKPAIAIWQQQINADPQKRHNFLVESAPISMSNGVADIANEVASKGFRLEFIKDSDIVMAYGAGKYTVKFVNALNRLHSIGRQDKFFILAYLDGTKIYFKDAGEVEIDTINGSFTMVSVVMPNDLTAIPVSVMPELALIIADLAKKQTGQQNRGLDIPPG